MAGRAAAPLPLSALAAARTPRPLDLLLSRALRGGSSLLGSQAPVIRGAGLGGRSPRPPTAPRGLSAAPDTSPESPQPHKLRHRGGDPGRRSPIGVRPLGGKGSLPPTDSEPAVAYRRVISVPRACHARAKDTLYLLAQSAEAGASCLFQTQFTPIGGGVWVL